MKVFLNKLKYFESFIMAILIYYLLVISLLLYSRSRILQLSAVLYLLILFAFSYNCADRLWYETKLNNYEELSSVTEPVFYYFMLFLNRCNLSVQYECAIIGVAYLSTLLFLFRKISHYTGYVLGMYMVANFFMDVIQLRFTLSLIFVYWGFYCLLFEISNRAAYLKFLFFILLASSIHVSSIWFIIMILIRKFSIKKIVVISIAFAISSLLIIGVIPKLLGNFFLYDVISVALEAGESEYTKKDIVWRGYMILFDSLCFIYMFSKLLKCTKGNTTLSYYNEIGIKICALQTILIPMLFMSANFHRHSLALLPILLLFVSRNFKYIKNRNYIYVISFIVCIYAFIKYTIGGGIGFGGIEVYGGTQSNLNLVFLSIFDYNLIFDYFS